MLIGLCFKFLVLHVHLQPLVPFTLHRCTDEEARAALSKALSIDLSKARKDDDGDGPPAVPSVKSVPVADGDGEQGLPSGTVQQVQEEQEDNRGTQ